MLNKPDVLDMLIKNYNQIISSNAVDTDLIYDYRHASNAKQHAVLKNKPDSLIFQLYMDEVGLTNPIGAKKDTQKILMVYFQLEDLPDNIKSMLKSIGLLAMCNSSHLSTEFNRRKFFEAIVDDLNALQINGIYIPSLSSRLNFAFTLLIGDNLASNDIGGFQNWFHSGQFCRHCHIDYNQKLIPLNEISYPQRIKDKHNSLVQQIMNSNNDTAIEGVVSVSPLSKLLAFHAVTSLPNDVMHDINEGNITETSFFS